METDDNRRIILVDPNDLTLMQLAHNSCFSGAVLPSGFQVPPPEDGKDWVSNGVGLELKKWLR